MPGQPSVRAAARALGIPMRYAGFALAMARPMPGIPSPASARTTTAPILHAAKTHTARSIPGGTMSAIRSPLTTPRSTRPAEVRTTTDWSSAKVMDTFSPSGPISTIATSSSLARRSSAAHRGSRSSIGGASFAGFSNEAMDHCRRKPSGQVAEIEI